MAQRPKGIMTATDRLPNLDNRAMRRPSPPPWRRVCPSCYVPAQIVLCLTHCLHMEVKPVGIGKCVQPKVTHFGTGSGVST
eukprot:scaffold499100_cov18-Prasinocladus_malaysianus.AAC.1